MLACNQQPTFHRPAAHLHGSAGVDANTVSVSPGLTRTSIPPWQPAATAMLPPIRKASQRSIFRSVTS